MNILVLDGQTNNPGDLSWQPVADLGTLTVYPRTASRDLLSRAKDAQIILTNKVPLTRDVLDVLTRLRFIQILATGWNTVDVDYAARLGIPVSNIPDYSTDSVAQHVFAFLLHAFNQIQMHADSVRQGDWSSCPDFSYSLVPMEELAGKTMGIVGYGRIGRKVASIARSFGMKVLAGRHPDGTIPRGCGEDPLLEERDILPLQELFLQSSVITLHVPLAARTLEMIGGELLSRSPSDQILINTARGGIVAEADLILALDSRTHGPRYYYTDVYSLEPPEPHPRLFDHPRVIVSPHRAWSSVRARQHLIQIAADNIRGFLSGKPQNLVPSSSP